MNEEQALSPLGYHLAKLPVPPKVLASVSEFCAAVALRLIFRLAKCCCGLSCCVVWSQLQPSLPVCPSRTRSYVPCISRCTHSVLCKPHFAHISRSYSKLLTPRRGALPNLRCQTTLLCERPLLSRGTVLTEVFLCCRYKAVKGWEAAVRAGSGQHFARENFLSLATLQMLQVQTSLCNRHAC
jgi:hypothetical protein